MAALMEGVGSFVDVRALFKGGVASMSTQFSLVLCLHLVIQKLRASSLVVDLDGGSFVLSVTIISISSSSLQSIAL
jgi:hypothetical protein